MVDTNTERLQAAAQENWNRDLNGAARIASGLSKRDLNGISKALFDKEAGNAYDELATLLGVAEANLPGGAGNWISTPDHASLDITGDIDLRVDAALASWAPIVGSPQTLIAKYDAATQKSYILDLNPNGTLRLVWSTTGSNDLSSASVAVGAAAGSRLAVRVTLDVDNGASQRVITFYTAPTINGPWTQLGSPNTVAGVTSIFAGTAVAGLGAIAAGATNVATGRFFAAEVRNGIDGTVVANPRLGALKPGTTSFTDGTGKVWTLNGTAAVSF